MKRDMQIAMIMAGPLQPPAGAMNWLVEAGLMRFTGNQWNEDWAWAHEGLECAPQDVLDALSSGRWRTATLRGDGIRHGRED